MEYKAIRSKRRSINISVDTNLKVIVRAPNRTSDGYISDMLKKYSSWIHEAKRKMEVKKEKNIAKDLSGEDIEELIKNGKEDILKRVNYFSNIMKVVPKSIKNTKAKTRWGSCSRENNICFSYRLFLLSDKLIDYVVVHELAHIRVKNHSSEFYKEIKKYIPDYKNRIFKLKDINII